MSPSEGRNAVSHESGDVPFEDQPTRRIERTEQPEQGESAEDRSGTGGGGPSATEERTGAGPGSTRPTAMREDFGTLADEGRKLWEAVETRIVAPVVHSYPEVARHLGAAGRELIAAFQAAVRNQEQVWRDPRPDSLGEKITVERVEPSGADDEDEQDDDRH